MTPGELFPAEGTLTLNADAKPITLMVANTGAVSYTHLTLPTTPYV